MLVIDKQVVERFLVIIDSLVADNRPWQEKKAFILECADETNKICIAEFCAWFDVEDDGK